MSGRVENEIAVKDGNDAKEQSSLEQAIDFMSDTNGGCFDPRHYHSFRGVSFLFPLRTCGVCHQRLQSVVGFSSKQVIQCLACKMLAHRHCAMAKETKWKELCPVNIEMVADRTSPNRALFSEETIQPGGRNDDTASPSRKGDGSEPDARSPTNSSLQKESKRIQSESHNIEEESCDDRLSIFRQSVQQRVERDIAGENAFRPVLRSAVSEGCAGRAMNDRGYSKAQFPFLSASSLLSAKSDGEEKGEWRDKDGGRHTIKRSRTWDGPSASGIAQSEQQNVDRSSRNQNDAVLGFKDEVSDGFRESSRSLEWTVNGPPVHWATGKSLEELFPPTMSHIGASTTAIEDDQPLHFLSHPFTSVSRALHENVLAHFRPVVKPILETTDLDNTADSHSAASEGESTSHYPDSTVASPSKTEMESLLDKAEAPGTDRRRLGIATVAGGIAGGVAGLAFAGPVGGVIGAKFGQTCGILGVVLEGSLAIGVVSSGIAVGRHAGQQLQDRLDQKRVLALSGVGTSRGILLVRPSVETDPAWHDFCKEARQSHQKGLHFSLLPRDSKATKRERYERESDIVKTDEIEIPTGDKVLLLASRILNNKDSMPGHVYRQLIEKLKERANSRGPLSDIVKTSTGRKTEIADTEMTDQVSTVLIRARRQDAHAVIKYVTATLLELRPGFAASPTITECTATAVEGLVFGEIYDLVIEEIEAEFEERENELLEKVAAFERSETQDEAGVIAKYKNCISEQALEALHHLPEAHSAVDKLRYCVTFLEKISEFFSNDADNYKKPMGADSLLKLVCQHLLAAKVFGINAQVAFLDEFARDEQLLRGKEGYALVTLQASLHFLNASTDFNADIFEQEDA